MWSFDSGGASWGTTARFPCREVAGQTVVLADCLAALEQLEPESVDVAVTSPPYNIGVAYRSYADRLPRAAYLDWMGQVGRGVARALRPDGALFLNVGSTNADPWVAMDVAAALRSTFTLQNHILWAKSLSVGDDTFGHFKPINSQRFLNHNFESVFHFTKTGAVSVDRLAVGVPFKDKSNIARWGHKQDRRCAGNVWFIPYRTVRSKAQKFDHPAGYPVELPLRCLRLHGAKQGAVVLDPFVGSGTTLLAAARLNLCGLGFEVDAEYGHAAVRRLEAERENAKTAAANHRPGTARHRRDSFLAPRLPL